MNEPKITADALMAACDEVEVANHPTAYKQAAAARARAAELVEELLTKWGGIQRDATDFDTGDIVNDLEALAAALKPQA